MRERALAFAERFLGFHGRSAGARLTVHRSIPAHSGLGSGTQLGLAVARALAELHGLPAEPAELARAVGRGRRSAIGTWTFALGGFIVEGGRRAGAEEIAPLLARFAIPERWRCVVAVPAGPPGLSGDAEAAAFERLPPPSEREVERVAHLVLMQLLPALVEDDLGEFRRRAHRGPAGHRGVVRLPAGRRLRPGPLGDLVRRMAEWGAAGVGQSSWGPAVYGLVGSEAEGRALAARVAELLGTRRPGFRGGIRRHRGQGLAGRTGRNP